MYYELQTDNKQQVMDAIIHELDRVERQQKKFEDKECAYGNEIKPHVNISIYYKKYHLFHLKFSENLKPEPENLP